MVANNKAGCGTGCAAAAVLVLVSQLSAMCDTLAMLLVDGSKCESVWLLAVVKLT